MNCYQIKCVITPKMWLFYKRGRPIRPKSREKQLLKQALEMAIELSDEEMREGDGDPWALKTGADDKMIPRTKRTKQTILA